MSAQSVRIRCPHATHLRAGAVEHSPQQGDLPEVEGGLVDNKTSNHRVDRAI